MANSNKSTFDQVMAENPQYAQTPKDPSTSIAKVYQAYKAGQMTSEEAKQFENDVNQGLIMLPKGASLSASGKPEPVELPIGVTEAYRQGKLNPEERTQLEHDLKAGLVKLPVSLMDQVPTGEPGWQPPTSQGIIPQPQEPSLSEKAVGAGEAALSAATGATGGTIGMMYGATKQLAQNLLDGTFGTQDAANLVAQSAAEGASNLTYAPRTPTGQQYAQNVGHAAETLAPIGAMTGEAAALGNLGRASTNQILQAAKPQVLNAVEAVKSVPGKVTEALRSEPPTGSSTSIGAAATDPAAMRQEVAQQLPAPIDLTKGQATRDFGQLRFEQEAAKNPELGAPIRQRMEDQHQAIRQSFDAWLDDTGAQAPDNRAAGITIDNALRSKAARDKAEVRVAYKEAEKAGELEVPVTLDPLIQTLNESRSAESTAPVLSAARKELIRLGGAVEDSNGNLIAKSTDGTDQGLSLAKTEQLRKFINKVTGADPTNIKFAGDLKRAIDTATEGKGGNLYQKARQLRTNYANQYENRAVIADLLENKRGSSDRRVALEDVADRLLFRSSLDDLKFAGKVLKTGGDDGQQAWKEVQGSAIKYIRDEATKSTVRDSRGNEVISPAALDKAIKRLDQDGKLDYLFGKQNAEKLRAVNDLSKYMFTAPPGAMNYSNTASVLLAALDIAISGSAGLPLPIASGLRLTIKNIKDRKLKAKINDALNLEKSK